MILEKTVHVNLAKLDEIRKTISADTYVKVGVIGDGAARQEDGVTNAEIGVTHEFGSLSNNIPPRSFLRMPLERNTGGLASFLISKFPLVMQGRGGQAFRQLGVFAESIIQEAFASRGFGQWAPNSPMTISRKGSSSPLIDTGQLRRSIASEVING